MTNVTNARILETIQTLQKDIGAKVDILNQKTNELKTDFSVMAKTVEQISTLSEGNWRTLRGSNGDQGLVATVKEVKREIEKIELIEKDCGLAGMKEVVYGGKDPGLIERVRDLEELGVTIRKWTYLAGSAVLLGIISLLFDVVPKIMLLINSGG